MNSLSHPASDMPLPRRARSGSDRLRIGLVSPKGPLYRHRGGIFRRSLRYMPLTLPTLAALVPAELNAEVICIDEGIAEIDVNLDVDLIGMTVITGTAVRAYALAAEFRGGHSPTARPTSPVH